MKVAVSSTGSGLDALVDPRFGRCPYFVVVNSETMASETIPNASQSTVHGAGIQTAQMIAAMGVQVVITGNIGPNAFQALSASGIKVITGTAGTVRQAVTKFMKGELKGTGLPTVQGHFGMGRGRAGGRGGGWGRTN